MLLALALGFAVAGADQLAAISSSPAGCRPSACSTSGRAPAAFAAVPLLLVAAPFLIMRNTLLGRAPRKSPLSSSCSSPPLIAGFWSLMSGMVLVMALQACGLLFV